MKYSLFSGLVLALSALSDATFLHPSKDEKVAVGETQTIQWESNSLGSLVSINVVKAGSVDSSKVLTQIATNVPNTGSYKWTPPKSISQSACAIAVVDVVNFKTIISENFKFSFSASISLCIGLSCHKGSDNSKTVTELSTVTEQSQATQASTEVSTVTSLQAVTQVSTEIATSVVTYHSVATSVVTVQNNLTAAVSTLLVTKTSMGLTTVTQAATALHNSIIVVVNGGSKGTTLVTNLQTFTATETVSASTAAALATVAPFSNGTSIQGNATVAAPSSVATAPAIFTGDAASRDRSYVWPVIGAAVVGFAGMLAL